MQQDDISEQVYVYRARATAARFLAKLAKSPEAAAGHRELADAWELLAEQLEAFTEMPVAAPVPRGEAGPAGAVPPTEGTGLAGGHLGRS
jgi:hypothetical protein